MQCLGHTVPYAVIRLFNVKFKFNWLILDCVWQCTLWPLRPSSLQGQGLVTSFNLACFLNCNIEKGTL